MPQWIRCRSLRQGLEGTSSNSTVLWSKWNATTRTWSTARTLVPSLPYRLSQSLAGTGNKAVYAWTRDMDGNLDSTSDRELFTCEWNGTTWTSPTQRTNDMVPDQNAQVAVAANGDVFFVWQQGGDLVMRRGLTGTPTLVRPDSQTAGFADFTMTLGPAGNLLLIWQEQSQDGVDANYAVYDPASGRWSKDARLFNDLPLERSFSAVWDNVGNLTLAYNRVELTTTTKTVTLQDGQTIQIEGVPAPGRVDLGVLKRRIVADLAILPGDFVVTGDNYLPGDQVTLTTTVRNLGDLALQNVVVVFCDGDPTNGGSVIAKKTIPGWLDGATNATVEATWTVPTPAKSHTLHAVVDLDTSVSEIDENNNTQSVMVAGTDLSASLISSSVSPGRSGRAVLNVVNAGATAPQTVLALRKAGETGIPLVTATVPALEPGQSAEVAMDLPPGSLLVGENLLTARVDDTAVSTDVDRADNEVTFTILLLSPADFNADGSVDAMDFAVFSPCFSGPSVPYDGSSNCQRADFDHDGDVDQVDFGIFQRCWSGSEQANPDCAH